MVVDPPSSTTPAPTADLLTREAVARRLAISIPTVDRLIARRELKAVRIGRRAVRVRSADLERFVGRLAEVR
jgi:excisionase family DNA binding protein